MALGEGRKDEAGRKHHAPRTRPVQGREGRREAAGAWARVLLSDGAEGLLGAVAAASVLRTEAGGFTALSQH